MYSENVTLNVLKMFCRGTEWTKTDQDVVGGFLTGSQGGKDHELGFEYVETEVSLEELGENETAQYMGLETEVYSRDIHV